jgi:hypothetical protein
MREAPGLVEGIGPLGLLLFFVVREGFVSQSQAG